MRPISTRALAVLVFLLFAAPGVAFAQEEDEPRGAAPDDAADSTPAEQIQRRVISAGPGGGSLEISAGPGSVLGKDELILREYVDIKFRSMRLQADYVRYLPSTHEAYAEGNVILDSGTSRIAAEQMIYNLESDTGTFRKARGYAEPNIYFEAEEVEKISADELVIREATFTACTQPIPYWSFKVGRGLLRLNDYAYLRNLSFKIGRVSVFYSPYLIWPIKTDRASGLLFPEFGFSRRSGTVLSEAFYWAIRRNMDATFYLDYLSLAGYGTGVEYRYVPNETGRGYLTGYYIRDQVAKQENREGVPVDRWVIDYGHQQDLAGDWRLVARANFISDFDYYLDFERDIRLSTNPQAVSNAYLTRNWGFYSLNLRGERREQLVRVDVSPLAYDVPFATREETIERWIEPEVELRSRRQRLGKAPIFLTLESSVDSFRKTDAGVSYQRLDAFPVLSAQLSPVPWLDLDTSAGIRNTYYTKSQRKNLGCDNRRGSGDYGEGNAVDDRETDFGGTCDLDPLSPTFDTCTYPPHRVGLACTQHSDCGQSGVFGPEDDLGCDNLAGTGDFGEGNGVWDEERTLVFDEGYNRDFYLLGLTAIGPKISRVIDRPGSSFSPQYKHTIEPTVRYTYQSPVEMSDRIIPFDEIDRTSGNANRLTYGVVTRLFAKRPAEGSDAYGSDRPAADATYVGADADPFAKVRDRMQGAQPGGAPDGAAAPSQDRQRLSTVEVATLEISQDYSFLGPLSVSGALDRSRQVSPIRGLLRFNPSIHTNLSARTSFDVIFRDIKEASLSANISSPRRGFLDLTWSMVRDLEGRALAAQGLLSGDPVDLNQIGLYGETNLFGRRLLLGMQINYELGTVRPGEPRLRDQRYKLGYNTQCCGFQFEILNRNYIDSSQQEFRFLINLTGVGNVVDLHQRTGGGGF